MNNLLKKNAKNKELPVSFTQQILYK